MSKYWLPSFIYIALFNLCCGGFFIIYTERPYVYYEYMIIPAIIGLKLPKSLKILKITALYLLVCFDILFSLSRIYFYDSYNYIKKIPEIFVSKPILAIIFIVAAIVIYVCIYFFTSKLIKFREQNNISYNKKIAFSIILFLLAFGIDIAAGTSHFNFNPKFKTHHNVAESLILSYYKDAKIYATQYLPVSKIENFPNQSATYKYLYNDSSNKQSLILLESWGLIQDSALKANEMNSFRIALGDKYQLTIDSSLFAGGTSQAQARELLNKTGQAYYSVIQNHQCDINSIIQEKNHNGYHTAALQSFSGFHSSSNIFNKAIGFKEVKEFKYFKNTLKYQNNNDNFYTSVNDEDVIEYGIKNASKHNKYFLYLITINTHLPFNHHNKLNHNSIYSLFKEDEVLGQYQRIEEQLNKIASIIAKSSMDRIVIVGDHAPPFLNENTRALFAKDQVPVWVITRKK